jgi:acyl CoA:acetate/3-ketoacid CoA transferase beta subunit
MMMSNADLSATVLLRELLAATERGLRVLAITSPLSLIAGLAARQLGAQIHLATGFGVLDAVDAQVGVTLGERAHGTARAVRGPSSDMFVALARGRVGVVVSPAQLDARGATNLSQVGGTEAQPGVALPGARGLPENNDSPGSLWYHLSSHTARSLVERVDSVSGAPPRSGRWRRLITPLGLFALNDGTWSTIALAPGVTTADVDGATGFAIEHPERPRVIEPPSSQEHAALSAVDPHGLRRLDAVDRDEAAAIVAAATAAERAVGTH